MPQELDLFPNSMPPTMPCVSDGIRAITKKECEELVLTRHYAGRMPQVDQAWGLFEAGVLVGVVCFGRPATPQVANSVVEPMYRKSVIELNRLVVTTKTKNAASSLVGHALRSMKGPMVVVSYADGAVGHVGYIYQATNFYFCGSVKAHDSEYIWNGKKYHPRVLAHMGIKNPTQWAKEVGAVKLPIIAKNRYLYLVGNKREVRDIKKQVKWALSKEYPKGDTKRHE